MEDFLGTDEDGRAPVSSFGARIQLAYLLGLIPLVALTGFRAIKALRNTMAHKVSIDLLHPEAQAKLDTIRGMVLASMPTPDLGARELIANTLAGSRTSEDDARTLLLMAFLGLESGLHPIFRRIRKLPAYRRFGEKRRARKRRE